MWEKIQTIFPENPIQILEKYYQQNNIEALFTAIVTPILHYQQETKGFICCGFFIILLLYHAFCI